MNCGERRHGIADGLDVAAGLHDRAVGPHDGGAGAAFAQPAVEFTAGGGEHDGGSAAAERVSLRIGGGSEILLSPDDPGAFFADVAAHAPHLMRRGAALVAVL